MKYNGKIIVLAYPDTFVTMSDEWICKFLPLVGLGTKEYIKAGHAALILIENETGEARYFDFGRYVTPRGMGRVRGANTDAELIIPFTAKFSAGNDELTNLNEFLKWLDENPDKTHGEGRLLASVCDAINFEKAEGHILRLQARGSIPYGAFHKSGSNCSRFVTDTILKSTAEKKIIRALRFNKRFTPSGVGNVEKAAFGTIFEVFEGVIKPFRGSAFKENLVNYFGRKKERDMIASEGGSMELLPRRAQLLEGIGSSAWFELVPEEDTLPKFHYRIRRYNDLGIEDFDGVFYSEELKKERKFEFTYDSNCAYCHVIQEEKKIKLEMMSAFSMFSSLRKVRSA